MHSRRRHFVVKSRITSQSDSNFSVGAFEGKFSAKLLQQVAKSAEDSCRVRFVCAKRLVCSLVFQAVAESLDLGKKQPDVLVL
jgi:hypothetical protein